jgi:hypothetical protein
MKTSQTPLKRELSFIFATALAMGISIRIVAILI